ncbi:MAG: WxcM-like domain-containing protein [Ignavibacteria bacterium]|nr:WxcM-like domain-containing protein [Ignavibacteria bacterium]
MRFIELPKFLDKRGNLSFVEENQDFPFSITRVFWTYDVPGGETRGGHALKTQQEVIIALSGSFDVVIINQNNSKKRIHLNRSYKGIFLPKMTWRYIDNFSTNSLSLHISDSEYDSNDYITDFNEFLNLNQ